MTAQIPSQGSPIPKRTPLQRLLGWGILGQVGYVISQFVILWALARFTTVETIGAFGLASAITFPVMWFFSLGLRTNQATDVKNEFPFADFLWLRAITCMLALLVIGLIIIFALQSGLSSQILIWFALAKAVELLCDLCYGVFQKNDKMIWVARSQLLRGGISAAVFVLVLALGVSAPFAFLTQVIVWSAVAFLVDLPAARRLAKASNDTEAAALKSIFTLAKNSFPLGVSGGLSAVQGNMPRYIITSFFGLAALGQFAVVAYIMQAMTLVANAVSASIVARMARLLAMGQKKNFFRVLRKLVVILTVIGCAGVGVSLWIGDPLIVFVFGQDYANLGDLLAVLVGAAALRSIMIFFQSGLQAARAFNTLMTIRIGFLGIMAIACLLAATWGGMLTIGLAMGATYVLQACVLLMLLLRLPFDPDPEFVTQASAEASSPKGVSQNLNSSAPTARVAVPT
ncbi:MAG: hypothetical protein AAGD04_07185 [Pseudomonadota bacterium]